MTELNCENVCLSAMALVDGQPAPLSADLIEIHLQSCPGCREEVAQLGTLAELLSAQKRREYAEDLWPAIAPIILEAQNVPDQRVQRSRPAVMAFVILGVLLLAYKLAEMLPQAEPGLILKLVPLLLTLAVFGYLKENPFKINTSLRLEGE